MLFYSSFPSEDALNEEFCANEIELCTYYYVSQFISPDISEFSSSTELASDSLIFPYQLEILKDEN